MAAALVSPIKPDAVADIQPLHRAAQVGFGRFQQQMKMVVHEDISVQPGSEALPQLRHQRQEMLPVAIVAVDGLPFVAPSGDMITSSGAFNSQRSRHNCIQFIPSGAVKPEYQMLRCDPISMEVFPW